jgi:hypothetical protein
MSEHDIDLSALTGDQQARWKGRLQQLPRGIRESLLKNLHKLPAERVAKLLRDNEPMISRLEGKLGGAAAKASSLRPTLPSEHHQFGTKSHYNATIHRGDSHGMRLVPLIALAVAFALVVVWVLDSVAR